MSIQWSVLLLYLINGQLNPNCIWIYLIWNQELCQEDTSTDGNQKEKRQRKQGYVYASL